MLRFYKLLILAGIITFCLSNICLAENGYDITNKTQQKPENYGMQPWPNHPYDLYDKYPTLGGEDGFIYWLDTSSCNYNINGGIATVGAGVFAGGDRGVYPDGTVHLRTYVYKFDTYKVNGIRKIILKSVIQTKDDVGYPHRVTTMNEDITQMEYEIDDGLLLYIFWQAAKYSGLSKYLD